MAKAIWTGSLSFGLVNIPVKLFNATSPKDVRFHQFDRETGKRVRYRRVTESPSEPISRWFESPSWEQPPPATGQENDLGQSPTPAPERREAPERERPREVAYEEIVKGFEIEPDRFVMVGPEELRALEPERTQAIEIEGFVDLSEIDPVHFEKSYYVAPQRGVGAEKPYELLLAALQQSGRVGIARFVMRTREYLAAIRPMEGVIGLETLFYSDEIRQLAEVGNLPTGGEVPERELAMALRFIELLEMPWEPSRYRDTYRERVLELLRERAGAEGSVVTVEPEFEASDVTAVPDLMAALKASVEAARRRSDEPAPRRGRRIG